MKRMFVAVAIAVMAAATPTLAAGWDETVETASGKVAGAVSGKVLSFKGIPFATPPVGELRWRPPQPPVPWTGVRPAEHYGADCMQEPFPGDAAPLGTPPAEDCLYLNVWRPAEADGGKLPVMVWIYGGGFVNGGASPAVYDGSAFAEKGVVLVSFNYRLGRFGFFAHPVLTEKARERGESVGNYAYMDQIAALEWVRDNIAAFGGDPGNVTIFGESAGGGSVLALLTSPAARGLFDKAIIQSGGGRSSLLGLRRLDEPGANGAPSAEAIGINFAKANDIADTGPAGLKALRALPAEAVVDGLNMASMRQAAETYVGGPILDGTIVVGNQEQILTAGEQAQVPVMTGANSADIGFSFARTMDEVLAPFGADREKARALYDPEGTDDPQAVGTRIAMDRGMIEPARFVAATVRRTMAAAENVVTHCLNCLPFPRDG